MVVGERGRSWFGLIGMEEGVNMLGGKFTLADAPGGGTVVEVGLPIRQASAHGGAHAVPQAEVASLPDAVTRS